ncbi:septal ring lytic transglycosylase RlpA family protein [Ramlibacter sp. GTP1]|uniref:Endolytic peptidoglycan transglycosylase RlpA n=2 Tax=Ramlibacter albus TaxID=2079448 RepID=A0A923M8W0_9BURK|nr:septal ring lytic transglycosylase RlpA family protein [Ramlibacter albus]MBC5764919.1 septal ring lytic transglycosylase RlpA family protein [Ramlibacter albus]
MLLVAAWAVPAQELPGESPGAPAGVEVPGAPPESGPPSPATPEEGDAPAAIGQGGDPSAQPADPEAAQPHDRGVASWYGPRFHGRRTASGERFDMHALTAAHPTLPFGTVVRVENPDDGRSVEVRINDRGPHIKQRIIDLSRAAARALGMLDAGGGLREVVLRIIKRPTQ